MGLEHSHTFRRARLATIALATAALLAISEDSRAQRFDRERLDVPYVPTPPEVVDRMMDMASVKQGDVVIDLGSGDGRIAIAAALRGARALGIDMDPLRIWDAQENARAARVQDKARFQQQDIFETRIGEATVLTLYLLTKINLKLRPRILKELKPGTRVVSHAFDMGDWTPDAEAKIGRRQVFMWIVPASAAGRWRITIGTVSFEIDLQQRYQHLNGSAYIEGKTIDVRRGWLRGNEIHLAVSDVLHLDGLVEGDRMGAMPGSSAPTAAWHAVRVP